MPTYTRKNEDTDPKPHLRQEVDDTESLENPILTVNNDNVEAYAKELAFLNQQVEVMIAPSQFKEDTTRLVSVFVNGEPFHFLRGEWRKCPLYVLEILATAKHQAWKFGFKQLNDGRTIQTQSSDHLLRFPHQYKTTDPKVHAWYDSIKDHVN